MDPDPANTPPVREVCLLVYPARMDALNADINARFQIRNTLVRDERGHFPLDRYRNAAIAAGDRLRVLFMRDADAFAAAELPEKIAARVLLFFKSGDPCAPFDCNGFIHFVHDVPFKFCDFDFARWKLKPFRAAAEIRPGQAILIGEREPKQGSPDNPVFKSSNHLAVYLSEGLYLSKFGTLGGLMVTDLPNMRQGFGGDSVWLLDKIR